MSQNNITDLPETNTAPETFGLEDETSFWVTASWQVRTVKVTSRRIRGDLIVASTSSTQNKNRTNNRHLCPRIGQTIPHHDSIQVEGTCKKKTMVTGKLIEQKPLYQLGWW